jgi:hypothetical protein
VGIVAYLRTREMERIIASIPNPETIIEEKMKQKIPLIVGPDGNITFPGMDKGKPPMRPDYMG